MDKQVFITLLLELLPALLPGLLKKCAAEIIEAIVRPILSPLEKQINELRAETVYLKNKCEQIESQERRQNLRFRGIPEKARESWADAEAALRNTLRTNGLPSDMPMERVHRLGPKRLDSKPRPLIAKFSSFKGRDLVFSNKSKFRGTQIFCEDDYAGTVKERRDILFNFALPIAKQKRVRFNLKYPFHDVYIGSARYTLGDALDGTRSASGANSSQIGGNKTKVSNAPAHPPPSTAVQAAPSQGEAHPSRGPPTDLTPRSSAVKELDQFEHSLRQSRPTSPAQLIIFDEEDPEAPVAATTTTTVATSTTAATSTSAATTASTGATTTTTATSATLTTATTMPSTTMASSSTLAATMDPAAKAGARAFSFATPQAIPAKTAKQTKRLGSPLDGDGGEWQEPDQRRTCRSRKKEKSEVRSRSLSIRRFFNSDTRFSTGEDGSEPPTTEERTGSSNIEITKD